MKEVKERQLIKITDDLIVKRGYVERITLEDGEIDWLMNGRSISDEHIKEMLEKRLNSIMAKKAIKKIQRENHKIELYSKYFLNGGN